MINNDIPVLELNDVSVTFGSDFGPARRTITAMNKVDLTVAEGETVGLVGESGSGKSTTGAVALGLRRPTSGSVLFDGAPFGSRRSRAGRIQAVLQHPQWSLNPRLRVGDSVAEPLMVAEPAPGSKYRAAVQQILDDVGLVSSFADRYPHELSGGQRQRVSVARALITRPRFIVFDEAVSALDVSVQAQILNLIKDLQAEHRFAALFISHDLAAVGYLAHRIAVMRSGVIMEMADAEMIMEHPEHEYTQQLLEAL